MKKIQIIMLSAGMLLLSGCSSNAGGVFSEYSNSDLQACEGFAYLSNPYDGSNETLWDYEEFDYFRADVEDAFWSAEHEDLVYYSDELISQVQDVLDELDNGSSKSDVEYEAEDIDGAVSDLESVCSAVTG